VAAALYPKLVCGYVQTELGEDARILAEWIAERDLGAYLRQRRAAPIGRMNLLNSSDRPRRVRRACSLPLPREAVA
jgi:hypothetical protein